MKEQSCCRTARSSRELVFFTKLISALLAQGFCVASLARAAQVTDYLCPPPGSELIPAVAILSNPQVVSTFPVNTAGILSEMVIPLREHPDGTPKGKAFWRIQGVGADGRGNGFNLAGGEFEVKFPASTSDRLIRIKPQISFPVEVGDEFALLINGTFATDSAPRWLGVQGDLCDGVSFGFGAGPLLADFGLEVVIKERDFSELCPVCKKAGTAQQEKKFLACGEVDAYLAANPGDFVPTSEICDALDNDCNAAVDDNLDLGNCSVGVGVCSATAPIICNGGMQECTAVPGPPEESPETSCSDGADNDCDGLVDLGDPDCEPVSDCPCSDLYPLFIEHIQLEGGLGDVNFACDGATFTFTSVLGSPPDGHFDFATTFDSNSLCGVGFPCAFAQVLDCGFEVRRSYGGPFEGICRQELNDLLVGAGFFSEAPCP